MPDKKKAEKDALKEIINALEEFDPEVRGRLIKTASMFFDIHSSGIPAPAISSDTRSSLGVPSSSFSADRSMSPKEFMIDKQPKSDVERVACLAFYLTHYRSTPSFKTLDISKLNTEAAQSKLSNAANAVANATKMGYLAAATKGAKQLSAAGERFVQGLPDREKAKSAMALLKPRRRNINKKNN